MYDLLMWFLNWVMSHVCEWAMSRLSCPMYAS